MPGDALHPAYFQTHFRRERTWDDWPEAFAVITAFATTGERWSPAQNAEADRRLELELRSRSRWVRRLTGYSPTTAHAEPGWAVEISFDDACEIGMHFRQDAVYYVDADQLQVSHCDARRSLVNIGAFRQRVHEEPAGV